VGANVPDNAPDLPNGIFTSEKKHHRASSLASFRLGRKILKDVIADQFLDAAVLRIIGGNDRLGIFLHQLLAGTKHSSARQIEPSAGDQTG